MQTAQRAHAPSLLDRPLTAVLPLSLEALAYSGLLVLGLALRLWDLGPRMLHHDESLHAVYSYYLYSGRGYRHDPMMHGPFQFHTMALLYFLFGVTDATARLGHALFGTALIAMPYFLRHHLGRVGALLAAAMITVSPTLLYFSRFAREDMFVLGWTALLVVACLRFLDDPQPRYLYLAVAGLAFAFSTKENTYLTVAILGAFLLLVHSRLEIVRWLGRSGPLTPGSQLLLVLGTISAPLGAAVFGWPFLRTDPATADLVSVAAFLGLLGAGAWLGLRWQPRLWATGAVIFWAIFVTLHTTFFSNPPGFFSGTIGGLKYWLEQQGVARGAQPWYYYFILLPLYEFLALPLALAGLVYWWRRSHRLAHFLIFWLLGSLLAYTWAAEKMPWLSVHITLPLILLAALTLGRLIESIPWRLAWAAGAPLYALAVVLTILVLGAMLGTGDPFLGTPLQQQQKIFQLVGLGLIGAGFAGLAVTTARRLGWPLSLKLLPLTALALLVPLWLRTAWQAVYFHGDIPVEMIVYTQTAPDVGLVMREIERLAFRTGEGRDLKVAYDSGVSWPFEWYLRDWRGRVFYGAGTPPLDAPVVLASFENDAEARARAVLGDRYISQRFRLRWWFPEDYRDLTPGRLWKAVADPETRSRLWRYFLYREPLSPLGSTDFVMFVRRDLAAGPWVAPQAAPAVAAGPAPTVALTPLQIIGGQRGSAPGQFNEPKGVAVGPDGSLYVTDSRNHRVQKFDASGRLLLAWGGEGSGPGQFNEPWGIAVDRQGYVYVADTWNHRIQKFDASGRFLAAWGRFGHVTSPQDQPGAFFGPRAIAIAPDGTLYVTDAGNHRLQRFDAEGNVLGVYGGRGTAPGAFSEPVGLAIDRAGNLYVADTWNRRIQKFDAAFRPLAQWPVAGWESESVVNKPYLAVDGQGRLYATAPEQHRVIRFGPAGQVELVWGRLGNEPTAFRLPTGLALDAQGNLYVVDSGNHRVLKFGPLP